MADVMSRIDATFDTALAKGGVEAEPTIHAIEEVIDEQRVLAKGLTLCWYKERYPYWSNEYRVVATEPEIRVVLWEDERYKVILMLRPDQIDERIADGALVQWELKTKANLNVNWMRSLEHNLQLIAQQVGIKQWAKDNGYGDRLVVGAIVEALLKGKRDKDRAGTYRQNSNLCYLYVKPGDGLILEDQISHTYKRDWQKRLVTRYFDIEDLVMNRLPHEETVAKTAVAAQLRPSQWEIDNAVDQWVQGAIDNYLSAECIHAAPTIDESRRLINKYFPQNTEHCFKYGPCHMLAACWDAAVANDPLATLYVVREPNHPEGDDD